MTDFNEHVPEMRDWNSGAGIDVGSWIGCSGDFRLAIGHGALFCSRFVEREGYVLRERDSLESLRRFEVCCKGNRAAVESVMNHLQIADLPHFVREDITRERLVY